MYLNSSSFSTIKSYREIKQRILSVGLHLHAYKIQDSSGKTSEANRSCAALSIRQLDIGASSQWWSLVMMRILNSITELSNLGERKSVVIHQQLITVSCLFFENYVGNAITINGLRCRNMLTNLLWPELNVVDVDGIWFQQRSYCRRSFLGVLSRPGRSELATTTDRFDTIRLFPLEFSEGMQIINRLFQSSKRTLDAMVLKYERKFRQRRTFANRFGGYLLNIVFHTQPLYPFSILE